MGNFKCSSCSSTDIQRLSMVHQSGISSIQTSTTATSKDYGGWLPHTQTKAKTSGTQVSQLARMAAPPQQKSVTGWVVSGVLLTFVPALLFNVSLSIFTLPFFGYMAWRANKYNATVYHPARAQWERSWLCHRCGTIFAA